MVINDLNADETYYFGTHSAGYAPWEERMLFAQSEKGQAPSTDIFPKKADMWAAGMSLLFMATGHLPVATQQCWDQTSYEAATYKLWEGKVRHPAILVLQV